MGKSSRDAWMESRVTDETLQSLADAPPAEVIILPLDKAYLCQDCHVLGNRSRNCPACASGVLLNLAGVINREPLPFPSFYRGRTRG